jgi:glycine hydroxymethyltransferase
MNDFLVRGSLADLDPDVDELIQIETERQFRKLIMIPSESTAPLAVREAMGSIFQNIYAEGYPDVATHKMSEEEILDYTLRLSHFRRYSDPRYYKGVEYADFIESLARRRATEAFATPEVPADDLYANVQPLSGAPANNAVFTALLQPGDTLMGMDLLHGGHLTHGSPVNRSGKMFNIVSYTVDPQTEKINYETVEALAQESKPKIIIAGYTSYPWMPDWKKFRQIADSVGAYLLADISHIAGMVAAGIVPTPVGLAHIITFTTHKTLCGPRAAVILTQNAALRRKIDRGVFPGEQGGPHVHIFSALALTFKLAKTDQFRELQSQIVKNNAAFTEQLQKRGFNIPFGGTDTHLGNVDCKTIIGEDGAKLSGDIGSRILDVAGIVVNRNTIPGDKSAFRASGIRYGSPWLTQRGFKEDEMVNLADIFADILLAIKPYYIQTRRGKRSRAKIDFGVLEEAKLRVRELAEVAGFDGETKKHGYPHFYYLDDKPASQSGWVAYDLFGDNIRNFVNYAFSSDVEAIEVGESQKTQLITPNETIDAVITLVETYKYRLSVPTAQATLASTWLRDLSDAYIEFDLDIARRLPGPIGIVETNAKPFTARETATVENLKPYYIGMSEGTGESLPEFEWKEPESVELRRTPLYETHKAMGAKIIPFAGWEMPVWYTSVLEEHRATREAAGLFDVAHMGVYQAEGPDALVFMDSVCSNDIGALKVGESLYTHLLTPDANVVDDLMVYRRSEEKYFIVVNASNDDKDWTWLNAVREGKVIIDRKRPWAKAYGRNVIL